MLSLLHFPYSAVVFQVVVQLLDVTGGQFVQLDVSDVGDNVAVNEPPVVFCRVGAHIGLGVQLESYIFQ